MMFKTETEANIHVRRNTFTKEARKKKGPRKTVHCWECDLKFKSRRQYLYHKKAFHSVVTFKCPDCDKSFKFKDKWQRHKKKHHKTSAVKYKCKDCPFKTKRKSNFDRHIKTIHKNEPEELPESVNASNNDPNEDQQKASEKKTWKIFCNIRGLLFH